MEKIFLERKILVVLLPALEKSTQELADLGSLISYQIKFIEQKYQKTIHFQNVIFDEFTYFAEPMTQISFNDSKNNYIFGCMDYYFDNEIFNYVLNNANTHVIMKYCSSLEIHYKIRLDLINNLQERPKLKYLPNENKNKTFIYQFTMELRNLNSGTGYVLSMNKEKNSQPDILNNEEKYYCQFINCEYIPAKREKEIWLTDHPRPIIYINNNQIN